VRSQLRTLSKLNAEKVARHLVAAGRLVDEDPQAALQHARAARALGARVAVVREAVGETAYAAGEWAEAIAELRTARRMTGDDSALPMIADAERALGRADRALKIAQSEEAQALGPAERAEMRIVEAGARHDLGQLDAALLTLQDSGLDRTSTQPWSARVWYAYADLLLAADREDEAREWFRAAADADRDGSTDADERLLQLDGIEVLEDGDEMADDAELTGDAGNFLADQDADEDVVIADTERPPGDADDEADDAADDEIAGAADDEIAGAADDEIAGGAEGELTGGDAEDDAGDDAEDDAEDELTDDAESELPHDAQPADDSKDAEPDPVEGDPAGSTDGVADTEKAGEPIDADGAAADDLSDGVADAAEVEIVAAPSEPSVTEPDTEEADAAEDEAAEAVLADVVDNPVEPAVEDEPVTTDGPPQPSSPIVLTFSDQAESGSSE
jgi:tetratricopeptide (TPR) repeat protein